jgi:DNA-binding transcriptional ArsR family regulator
MAIGLVSEQQMERLSAVAERLDARGLREESETIRQILAQLEQGPREVPASEAAEILEVTSQTIRNWIRAGILPGRQDQTGHFFVALDALEPAIRLRAAMPRTLPFTITEDEIDAEIEAVRSARRSTLRTQQ